MIIGFVQYQHSSVQLVLKKWIDIPSYAKRTLEKRADRIPEMLNARKQGKTAFFIMDKLIIKDRGRPPDFDARDETGHSDEEDNEVFINRS